MIFIPRLRAYKSGVVLKSGGSDVEAAKRRPLLHVSQSNFYIYIYIYLISGFYACVAGNSGNCATSVWNNLTKHGTVENVAYIS